MKTPNGKIGRLPAGIQEDVNLRLQEGWEGPQLLAWLNSLPAVREVLDRKFGGREIKHQNLTAWRQGGYREWKFRRDFFLAALDRQAAQARQARRIQSSAPQPPPPKANAKSEVIFQWPNFENNGHTQAAGESALPP